MEIISFIDQKKKKRAVENLHQEWLYLSVRILCDLNFMLGAFLYFPNFLLELEKESYSEVLFFKTERLVGLELQKFPVSHSEYFSQGWSWLSDRAHLCS